MKSRVRASAVVIHNERILCIRAQDPKSKKDFFFLPGGEVEPEETSVEAAERETFEETGFSVKVDALSCIDREYIFHWNGEDYDCLTLFYRAHLTSPIAQKVVDEPEYNLGVAWIPRAEFTQTFGYTSEVLDAVLLLSVAEPESK
jgi:8-oxo-dGTP pyrophosphatase MutT (NUDIX family)